MSSKVTIKPLLSRNLKVNDHHLLSNPNRCFNAYEDELENNLRTILRKYSHLDRKKVSDLLEELDNNLTLAMQILDEEESHCNSILEERREGRRQPALSQEEENCILKQSFLKLYKKLIAKTAELEETQKKYESQRLENQKLKQLNLFLMQGEYNQLNTPDVPPICWSSIYDAVAIEFRRIFRATRAWKEIMKYSVEIICKSIDCIIAPKEF